MWLTPRAEPKLDWILPASPSSNEFRQIPSPLSSVKFAPPSVDFHSPNGGRPGARLTVSTRNGAHSAHGARGTDVHGASANHDRGDGAPVESRTGIRRRVPARGRHRGTLVFAARCVHVCRDRLICKCQNRPRITRCVRLAGSRVERARRSVVSQRPDRIGREAARDECPVWRVCERLVCAPDTAACGSNPEHAVVVCASRRNRQRSNATGGDVTGPLKVKISGKFATARAYEGPGVRRGCDIDFTLAQAFCAFRVSLNGMSLAG